MGNKSLPLRWASTKESERTSRALLLSFKSHLKHLVQLHKAVKERIYNTGKLKLPAINGTALRREPGHIDKCHRKCKKKAYGVMKALFSRSARDLWTCPDSSLLKKSWDPRN